MARVNLAELNRQRQVERWADVEREMANQPNVTQQQIADRTGLSKRTVVRAQQAIRAGWSSKNPNFQLQKTR